MNLCVGEVDSGLVGVGSKRIHSATVVFGDVVIHTSVGEIRSLEHHVREGPNLWILCSLKTRLILLSTRPLLDTFKSLDRSELAVKVY